MQDGAVTAGSEDYCCCEVVKCVGARDAFVLWFVDRSLQSWSLRVRCASAFPFFIFYWSASSILFV